MPSPTFESYSQNGEDVVLWRALRGVSRGNYIDVGANHPRYFSVSMAFYALGWTGITVEPDPEFAALQRQARPRDFLVEAAATADEGGTVTLHVVDSTGLSTLEDSLARRHAASGYPTHELTVPTRRLDSVLKEAGWDDVDIHFMSVDTEGSEREVLEGIDLSVWRPWVLVIEATAPLSTRSTRALWEPLVVSAGYRFCLFDGLSCFYVAEEHADALAGSLDHPACPHDAYTTFAARQCEEKLATMPGLVGEVAYWRSQALTRWSSAVANLAQADELRRQHDTTQPEQDGMLAERDRLQHEVLALRQSTSWRLTKPLRVASGLTRKLARRW